MQLNNTQPVYLADLGVIVWQPRNVVKRGSRVCSDYVILSDVTGTVHAAVPEGYTHIADLTAIVDITGDNVTDPSDAAYFVIDPEVIQPGAAMRLTGSGTVRAGNEVEVHEFSLLFNVPA